MWFVLLFGGLDISCCLLLLSLFLFLSLLFLLILLRPCILISMVFRCFSVFSIAKVDTSDKKSLVFPDYGDPTFSQGQSSSSFVVPTINNTDSGKTFLQETSLKNRIKKLDKK